LPRLCGCPQDRWLKLADLQKPQFTHSWEALTKHRALRQFHRVFWRKCFERTGIPLGRPSFTKAWLSSRIRKRSRFPGRCYLSKEGTFWSDHPVGVVEREWVTSEHREAAKIYIQYLLARPQQLKAMQYGFRPPLSMCPLLLPWMPPTA